MERISVQELALKARSKNEVYRLLSSDCKLSIASLTDLPRRDLPAAQEALHPPLLHADPHWRQKGKAAPGCHHCSKHILNKDVKRVDVPHYPNLTLDMILEQFKPPHRIWQGTVEASSTWWIYTPSGRRKTFPSTRSQRRATP